MLVGNAEACPGQSGDAGKPPVLHLEMLVPPYAARDQTVRHVSAALFDISSLWTLLIKRIGCETFCDVLLSLNIMLSKAHL